MWAATMTRDERTFTIEIEQSLSPTPGQPHKKLMHMPLRIGLVGAESGSELTPTKISGAEHHGDMFEIRQRRHKMVFHGIDERPVLSINRGFQRSGGNQLSP